MDRLILTDVARHVGATVEALHQREERPSYSRREVRSRASAHPRALGRDGCRWRPYFGPSVAAFLTQEYDELPQPTITRGHELEDESYIEGIRKVLGDLAEGGNVVIVGRGAHIILKDNPRVLRVGAGGDAGGTGSPPSCPGERLSHEEAEKTIVARDKARAYYFNRFFDIDEPDSPELYHLVINTSAVDLEYAADLVVQAAKALQEGRLPRKEATPLPSAARVRVKGGPAVSAYRPPPASASHRRLEMETPPGDFSNPPARISSPRLNPPNAA